MAFTILRPEWAKTVSGSQKPMRAIALGGDILAVILTLAVASKVDVLTAVPAPVTRVQRQHWLGVVSDVNLPLISANFQGFLSVSC